MNDETKKSLMKVGVMTLENMDFHEWLRLRKEIALEREAEARKNDPKYVKRYDASDSMQESETGEMVRYEDFIRIAGVLEEKVKKAENKSCDCSGGYDISTSWRD
jgi:hypothetical protein